MDSELGDVHFIAPVVEQYHETVLIGNIVLLRAQSKRFPNLEDGFRKGIDNRTF